MDDDEKQKRREANGNAPYRIAFNRPCHTEDQPTPIISPIAAPTLRTTPTPIATAARSLLQLHLHMSISAPPKRFPFLG